MTHPALAAAKAANQEHVCRLPGCAIPRHGLSHWCRTHGQVAARYGHPNARPLQAKQWASQRALVRDLLQANEDHPGQQQALAWVTRWVRSSDQYTAAFKGAEEVQRLTRHGVHPIDILVEVCALSLWMVEHPAALPTDLARDFAVSRAVFGLAPRERRRTRDAQGRWGSPTTPASYSPRAKKSALRHVGTHLRNGLALFIANVQASSETLDAQRAAALEAMRAPLRPPLGV